MKVIRIDLNLMKDLEIIPLSDIHVGSKECNVKLLKQTIDYIKNNENVYTIINGDMVDNTIKNCVGSVYENKLTPMEQLLEIINLLEPIKNKILIINAGNHENRTLKEDNIDITYLVAKQLNITDKYVNGFWYLYLYFGEKKQGRKSKMVYTITGYHGSGGGRKLGGKANRLVDMKNIAIADLYIMSHTHTPVATKDSIYVPDYSNKALTLKEMYYLMTNSFLNNGGYGELAGFTPTSNSICSAVLNSSERKIKVTI